MAACHDLPLAEIGRGSWRKDNPALFDMTINIQNSIQKIFSIIESQLQSRPQPMLAMLKARIIPYLGHQQKVGRLSCSAIETQRVLDLSTSCKCFHLRLV